MKRIDEDQLHRVALAKGATIEHAGGTVNAGRQQLALAKPRAVEPAPEPPPAPDAGALMAEALRENSAVLHAVMKALREEIRAQQSPTLAPIVEWHFTIQRRDRDDLITGITAHATREGTP